MPRAVATLLIVGGALLALTGQAVAAPGQIGYDGCLANDAATGCVDLPGTPIDGAQAVAVSPDGRSVYVAAVDSNSIAHFFVGPEGRLAYDRCLASTATPGCIDLLARPLDKAYGVAVSPDGRSVYVTGFTNNRIEHFFRSGPQGQLGYDGCLETTPICITVPPPPLNGPVGVAVSPDGRSVYVASVTGNSIAHFFVDPQGQLAYDGCLASSAAQGCIELPDAPLDGARAVAVSPDGRSVYVASVTSNSIAHFVVVGPQGQLAYDGCLASTAAATGCVELPGAPLDYANGVAVSPDGRSVYVASASSHSVAHFFVGPEGRLAYDGCLASTAAQGCIDLPGAPLDGARGVAVSPDGRSIYVASVTSNSIAHFFAGGPQGQLAYDGCLANDDAPGCANVPGAPLDGAAAVAVSPDGRSVYISSGSSHSIAHFFRALGDAPPPGSVTTPGTRPGRPGESHRFGSKTLITLKLAAKRIPARGPLPILVTNANGFTVSGQLSAQAARPVFTRPKRRPIKLKSKTFRVAANRQTTVKLKLPTTLGRLLKHNGKLTLRLQAKVHDPAGHSRTVSKTLTPRLKRKAPPRG